MHFVEIGIEGAYVIELEKRIDTRGYFARTWCQEEFTKRGLEGKIAQINTGFSPQAGTLRGLHYQRGAYGEVKIARCVRGSVFDVILDLRPQSTTFMSWKGFTLTPETGEALYIPKGCAHGYLTLEDNSELMYTTSHVYVPESAAGVRYNDDAFAIDWPTEVIHVSDADRTWPSFVR